MEKQDLPINSYLEMQYKEGINILKFFLESRYKILQFIGYFNAAVLSFGFSQGVLLTKEKAAGGVIICVLSIFVAGMGLATEFSNRSYLYSYFNTLKEIERTLGADIPDTFKGIFTSGASDMEKSLFHKIFPVHRAHKLFYLTLITLWTGFSIYHAALPFIN
jgi:hypothetical protein